MPKSETTAARLARARRTRQLVRFRRPFEKSRVHGYVLGVGSTWFLLAPVSDGIWLNGFQCFRARDVRELAPDPYAEFVEAVLRKRRVRRPARCRVRVSSLRALLASAAREFPLVTIHREAVDPDVCWIGRVEGCDRSSVSLRHIWPGARWESAPTRHAFREITRVDFGGDYEEALHLVGGEPDSASANPPPTGRRPNGARRGRPSP